MLSPGTRPGTSSLPWVWAVGQGAIGWTLSKGQTFCGPCQASRGYCLTQWVKMSFFITAVAPSSLCQHNLYCRGYPGGAPDGLIAMERGPGRWKMQRHLSAGRGGGLAWHRKHDPRLSTLSVCSFI